MKTRYPKVEGCVPNPGKALSLNVLTPHFQRDDIIVELDDGSATLTGHVMADGRVFDYKTIYGEQDWEYAHLTQFSFINDEGEHEVLGVDPRHPHPIDRNGVTTFGYVSKINGKRWGVTVHINYREGTMQIIGDIGSPVIGVLIQLI